jgi:CheY-like chemotaxis protein
VVNQEVQSRLLEKLGHTVTIVGNGKEAVSVTVADTFDLIILDIQMPEMDGLEAATIIRSRQKDNRRIIPIMALTAHAAAEDRERCRAAGMDGYLSKPLRMADLERGIANLLGTGGDQKPARRKRHESSVANDLIDEQKLLEGLGGDHELLADVFRLFLDDSGRQLRDIRSAIARNDGVGLGHSAHALKGSIANLSSGPAYIGASVLERMANSGECASTSGAVAKLEDALQTLQSAVADAWHKYARVPRRKIKHASGAA